MRKLNLYFWFIALVGLITSCSQDETDILQTTDNNRVSIGANINQAVQTRAASVTIPTGYQLRYVLEVWNTGDTPARIYRDEKTATGAEAVEFNFTLSDAGDYKALLWADFVLKETQSSQVDTPNAYTHYADLHYVTNYETGLKAVALAKTGTDYVINDDARDAFFACLSIKKETGAFKESVELTRPFGQINVIEKNTDLLGKVASMTPAYSVPQTFDVEMGTPSGTVGVNPTVTTLPTATDVRKANLFYDFIFAPATGQTTLGQIGLQFTDDASDINLDKSAIPANMPVVRNKRTNISGSILHTSIQPSDGAKLSVTVSDDWTTPDKEIRLPQVGDYYYADGTWSTDFTDNPSNPCIGIVFQTDPSRIGEAEKKALEEKNIVPHGLVMAVKNAGDVGWGSEAFDTPLKSCETQQQCENDINGLSNYNTVLTYLETLQEPQVYAAFYAVGDYDVKAPENTTGWYLPSIGQLYDICANLGNLPGWEQATSAINDYYWEGKAKNLMDGINAYLLPLGAGNYDAIGGDQADAQYMYWSSSEYNQQRARCLRLYQNNVQCAWNPKNSKGYVRPVLAF